MRVPEDWLVCPIPVRDVEDRLAEEGAPDFWLAEWRGLVGRLGPEDRLWEYAALQTGDPMASDWDWSEVREGIAVVRGGEVIDAISTWF